MNEIQSSEIILNYNNFISNLADICTKYARDISDVQTVVVTKGQDSNKIKELIKAGANIIGENYPEETCKKKLELGSISDKVSWHMIGHLQTRKSKLVIDNFDYLHSLDSVKLAARINRQILDVDGKPLSVLLQYNVSGEVSKFGWDASDESKWAGLIKDLEEIISYNKIKINGLMTMPPLSTSSDENRVYFDRLRRLSNYFQLRFPDIQFNELSMGTSHDFVEAIKEGATLIRIGTAITGKRSIQK
jgi:pyridoxal phosphate enzyme (YggS family)